MLLQAIGATLALIGYFGDIMPLFLVSGFLFVAMDIYGYTSGQLDAGGTGFTILLYIIGYIFVGNWHGILVGSIFGHLIEMGAMLLIGSGFGVYKILQRGKNKTGKNTFHP